MFSELRPGLVYRDTSRDITENDDDYEAEEWEYDGRTVYRGSFDPAFLEQNLHVYSLYDDKTSIRVGIAEHDINEPEVYSALWFRDNPFEMLLQEEGWTTRCTIWTMLSYEAYNDCLEDDFKKIIDKALMAGKCLVTPSMIISPPTLYSCNKCNKKSLSNLNCCSNAKASVLDFKDFCLLFFDDSNYYIMDPPFNSEVYSKMNLRPHVACEEQPEPEQMLPPSLQESHP